MTDLPSGRGQPGWARTNQVIARLKARAAQYGGRMRQARRRANVASDSNRHPDRAGPRPSEKPDRVRNTITAKRPYVSSAAQKGAWSDGKPSHARRKMWFSTTNTAARPLTPSRPAIRPGAGSSAAAGIPVAVAASDTRRSATPVERRSDRLGSSHQRNGVPHSAPAAPMCGQLTGSALLLIDPFG